MSILLHGAETWTFLVTDMNTLEAFHMRCQQQILDICGWTHVSNAEVLHDLVCQPLVTSYIIVAYLCLAMLHAWTLEYQHMMPFV